MAPFQVFSRQRIDRFSRSQLAKNAPTAEIPRPVVLVIAFEGRSRLHNETKFLGAVHERE